METPSSTRRVTRSQALASATNCNSNSNIRTSRKIEDSEKGTVSKSRQQTGKQLDRSALIDITNDSPIVGLAMASLETPLSAMSKMRNGSQAKQSKTPGSGEALLRGQVKTLLQKVEEEAELSKLLPENRPFLHLRGLFNSPAGILAPTPANTPHDLDLSDNSESFKNRVLASVTPSPVQEQLLISQMVSDIFDGRKQEDPESDTGSISRSLLLDFFEKSDGSDSSECLSVVTQSGGHGEGKEKSSMEEDDASVWSIQVNASSRDEEYEDDDNDDEGIGYDSYYEEAVEEEEDEDGGWVDELCEGLSKISVNGGEKKIPKFSGKHTRFFYNSDDELEGEEECGGGVESEEEAESAGLLPTPKGKHLRFPEEEVDN